MTARVRIDGEPAFVLHQRPYRNSSQLLECLTLNHGRIGLVAQGSRRIGSGRRALLQAFTPLRISWMRRGELGRLIDVEGGSQMIALGGEALLAGYYANELILSLTSRDDPTTELFAHYAACLNQLGSHTHIARSLRLFEYRLLAALGVGLQLDVDCMTGRPLDAEFTYAFNLDSGATRSESASGILGAHLISLREERLEDAESLRAARALLGQALARQLGSKRLRSREVFRDIDARGLNA